MLLRRSSQRGFMDLSLTVLMVGIGAIVLAPPYLLAALHEEVPGSLGRTVTLMVISLAVLGAQLAVISAALSEAHQHARSGGVRMGLNREPALHGAWQSAAVVACYAVGLWRMRGAQPEIVWAPLTYVLIGVAVIVATVIAHRAGVAGAEKDKAARDLAPTEATDVNRHKG